MFEPLVPGAVKVPETNHYRCPTCQDEPHCSLHAAEAIEEAIVREGPETVAAVFLEPVQNAGGCFVPPPGYFDRVREICDRHGVLLVSDEVICAFGRIGRMFGCERYGYQPDIITSAKGLTSGYAPLGAMIVSDRIAEPFVGTGESFIHGFTFAGHPVSCAVALANLKIFEDEDIVGHVQANEDAFRAALDDLSDLPIVGDIRGTGYFYAIELVRDRDTRSSFSDEERESLLRGFLSNRFLELGLICRADDRGEPVIQLSPPLIAEQAEFRLHQPGPPQCPDRSHCKDAMMMATSFELDVTDKAIIAELQVQGRLAYAKLAPLVGLSEAATRKRVNKLLERGVMEIVAVTDPTRLGLSHQSMVGINVDADVRKIADELARIEAIDYVVVTAGRYDILAEVFSADATQFVGVINDQIRPIPGIINLEILTYLDLVKQTYNWGTA